MKTTLFLGIDSAMHNVGLACQLMDETMAIRTHVAKELMDFPTALRELLEGIDLESVMVVAGVESPTWTGQGTREARAAAVQIEAALQRVFPKRRVFKVCPNQWQSALLYAVPGKTAKERSLFRVRKVMGLDVATDHEADAVNVMMYAQLKHENLITDPPAPKGAPKPNRLKGGRRGRA